MARDVVALVSSDDAIAAIRVHADRVHDLLRRDGCGPQEAVEVTEAYAFALLDALVTAPQTVGDMAGWWFGRALELTRRLGSEREEVPDEASMSVLAGTQGEAQVRAALDTLPPNERAAVVLRDAYDLPAQAVAVALRRDQETSDALVAAGRLHLVATYDSRPVPDLGGHSGRTPADLPTLSRLADGTLAPQRTVGLRRHLPACVGCEETVEALAKGRRLAAGLPVIAMPDEEREAMLERAIARANATLPSVDDVLVAIEEDDDVQPAVSPLLVVAAIVFALILGVAVAAITRSSTGNATDEQLQTAPSATPVSPAFSVSASPSTSVSTTPTKSASATRSPTAPPSSSAPAVVINPAINIDPSSGPRGTAITVQGTGWEPSDTINIRYTGPVSTANQVATASRRGTFTVTLTANGLVPGDYTISASGGSGSASASFRQTS